jgi:hypothetical protein
MARILDPTTPKELLWRDALDLVAELIGEIAPAKALLIAYLPENIRLRYALMDGYRSPGFPAKSATDAQGHEPPEDMKEVWVNRDPTPHDQRFWHPDEAAGERLITHDKDSSFRWKGPPKFLPLPHFKPPPTDFTVTLLWLDRDDIIKVLRFAGLLPPAQVPEPAAAVPNSPDADVSAPSDVRGTLTATQANQTLAAAAIAGTVRPSVEPIPRKNWLRAAKRERPQQPDETTEDWAEAMIDKMKEAKAAGLVDRVWSQTTMERRLRDKDEDGDETYQVGN